jgi:hypothetical protein
VRSLLKADGRLLVVEPIGHVSGRDFAAMQAEAQAAGLVEAAPFRGLMSRGVLLGRVEGGVGRAVTSGPDVRP